MHPNDFRFLSSLIVLAIAAVPCGPDSAMAAELDTAVAAQRAVDETAAESQARINEISDRIQDTAGRYAQALTDADSFEKYNKRLEAQVRAQDAEIGSIEQQLVDIETTSRDILPLMQSMVEALEAFVALDIPFLAEERRQRVENLESIMDRADVSIAEKYRRILEAYQIELENGRTLEAYDGWLGESGGARAVEFVRLGRVSLMYRTRDGQEAGYWNVHEKTWTVDDDYADDVDEALRVARKVGAPVLLTVPVPAPKSRSR